MVRKRKRGAPRGNKNAVKHGFYSKTFSQAEQFDFDIAAGIAGVSEEIALLRFEIKKAISGGDIKNLVPLIHTAIALEKLIRTYHRFFAEKQDTLKIAMENVFSNVLLPLGSDELNATVARHVSRQIQPDTDLKNE